jgi:hypothetical protein
MSKQTKKVESKKEEVISQEQINSDFEILDDLFFKEEDNYNAMQDERLLQLVENDNRFNDKVKIKWLFKRYRDTARELNNC